MPPKNDRTGLEKYGRSRIFPGKQETGVAEEADTTEFQDRRELDLRDRWVAEPL